MSEPTAQRPSVFRATMKGLLSGAINGAIMVGIFSIVGPWLGLHSLLLASTETAFATIITTALFSGGMAIKRALSSSKHEDTQHTGETTTLVPVVSQSVAMTPALDVAESQDTSRGSWAERTGRSAGSQSNIKRIIADNEISDRTRAEALLAERERSAGTSASIS